MSPETVARLRGMGIELDEGYDFLASALQKSRQKSENQTFSIQSIRVIPKSEYKFGETIELEITSKGIKNQNINFKIQVFDDDSEAGVGKDIPLTTKILLGISHFLIGYWWQIILALIGGVFLLRYLLRMPSFRLQYDRFILFMPIIGKLNQTIYSARCARTFASLYLSGVPALDMLMITGKVLNNSYLEKMFDDVIAGVSRGEFISTAIQATGAFDPMLSSMIYIGEEAGALGDILSKTADYFDEESDAAMQRMVSLMEPVMIVVLGIMVAFIVISIMQPMFKMYDSVGKS